MKPLFITILVLALVALLIQDISCADPQNWAVLVAGSNQYYNYRHQADICNSFQMLRKQGIPESNIIVMMYDDIATNSQNPNKGSIVNCYGCPNVYPGVPKDYTGDTVTAENFLKILRGEDMKGIGSGKTLKSGPNDNIFVFYSDHGGPGIIAMPVGPFVYAKDLMSTFQHMKEKKMYKKMVFYLEACESGSMFNNLLPADWNIYAATASNPFQSSYACDYDAKYKAFLNDCWSRNFMNDTMAHSLTLDRYSLEEQFETVKKMTTESQACQYGDEKMGNLPIGNFMSNKIQSQSQGSESGSQEAHASPVNQKRQSRVLARDVKTQWLRRQVAANDNDEDRILWLTYLQEHELLKSTLKVVWESFAQKMGLNSLDQILQSATNDEDRCHDKATADVSCMKDAVEAAERACGPFVEESLVYTHFLNNACLRGISPKSMEKKLKEICSLIRIPNSTMKF